ncbi:hypothetical protein COOONC_02045 [Cooperia oncophora]
MDESIDESTETADETSLCPLRTAEDRTNVRRNVFPTSCGRLDMNMVYRCLELQKRRTGSHCSAPSILGQVSSSTVIATSTTEFETAVTQARIGWTNLAVCLQSVSSVQDDGSRLSQREMRKGHELSGMVLCVTRKLRYNKDQALVVTRTSAPPGSQINDQIISGDWPDPGGSGAQAALPELLAGNYFTAAQTGIAGIQSFLEERRAKQAQEKTRTSRTSADAFAESAMEEPLLDSSPQTNSGTASDLRMG